MDGLKRHGVDVENIDIAWVPGAFEVPFIAKKMAETKKYGAVIKYLQIMGIQSNVYCI